jgi:hypothetical protein
LDIAYLNSSILMTNLQISLLDNKRHANVRNPVLSLNSNNA